MRYILKGSWNSKYNDFHLNIDEIFIEDKVVNFKTRIENIDDDDKILYRGTTLTYQDAIKQVLKFFSDKGITFPNVIIKHIQSNPIFADGFEFYAK